ncbi:hypothetical protein WDH52_24100 [Streptomyces sp. TRM70308]|uniref:hypothetical protein n=1 Tax=Streptomyces sp. TRM70308 TaxID=3131932 RepID=UPI003CFC53F4
MRTPLRALLGATTAIALGAALPLTAQAAEAGPPPTSVAASASASANASPADVTPNPSHAAAGVRFPQSAWSYHITSSCSGHEDEIRRGAEYWGYAVETAFQGTRVDCVSGYVPDCNGPRDVGCNWNSGERIAVSTQVNDLALLAAHEFGHNWNGHTAQGCATWKSPYDVMKTWTC